MTKNYIIGTESSCDLPIEKCRELGVETLFAHYLLGDETFTDTMVSDEIIKFYGRMRAGDVFATSQISIGEYADYFKALAKQGLPVMHVTLGSGITGGYENALLALDMVHEEFPDAVIEVVDSKCASLGYGALVLLAAENREKGMPFEENVAAIRALNTRVHPCFTTDTLTYLTRGGRVSKVGATIGNMLSIKPVLKLDNAGRLMVFVKAVGRKMALKKMADYVEKNVVDPESQTLYISHADNVDGARELGEYLKARFHFKDVYYTLIGAIVGAHTGPGLQAAYFFGGERT